MGKIINMDHVALDDNDNVDEIQNYLATLLDRAADMEYNLFVKAVRTNANPPIKGRLTPKKLKDAEITRCFNQETMESWLEQRGEIISEKFRIVWK